MNIIKRSFIIVSIIIGLTGFYRCTERNSENSEETRKAKSAYKAEVLKIRDKQDDFIFLHYWEDMTDGEFQVISDSLVSYGILKRKNDSLYIELGVPNLFEVDRPIELQKYFITADFKPGNFLDKVILNSCEKQLSDGIISLYTSKYGKPEVGIIIGVEEHYTWILADKVIALKRNMEDKIIISYRSILSFEKEKKKKEDSSDEHFQELEKKRKSDSARTAKII